MSIVKFRKKPEPIDENSKFNYQTDSLLLERRYKNSRLEKIVEGKSIHQLLILIEKGDPTDRMRAIGKIHDLALEGDDTVEQAIPFLIKAYKKWGLLTKLDIIEAMGAIRSTDAIKFLREVFSQSNDQLLTDKDESNQLLREKAMTVIRARLIEQMNQE
jgi:hypothetical protein